MRRRACCAVVLAMLLLAFIGGAAGAGGLTPPGAGAAGPWACLYGPGYARFVPGVAEWQLGLVVVGDGWGKSPPALQSVSVTLDGRPLDAARVQFVDAPWVRANGALDEADALAVKSAMAAAIIGEPPSAGVFRQLEAPAARLAAVLAGAQSAGLTLTGMASIRGDVHWVDVTLDYQGAGRLVRLVQRVQVVTARIPREPGWFSSDLHEHSTFSDGNQTPAERRKGLAASGYFIGYLTDHTDLLMQHGSFADMSGPYPAACRDCSDTTTSMFPGVEMTVVAAGSSGGALGTASGGASGAAPAGDCLGYGVKGTAGLDNKKWPPQAGLDRVDASDVPLSSVGIAHPYGRPTWQDWTVQRYYGIELMSGIQTNFAIGSSPVEKWRSECLRLAAAAPGARPSARTGSDFHRYFGEFYVTHILLPSDAAWFDAAWDGRWQAVSAALRDGRTAVSRKGSLAYITADGQPVGSSLTRPAGGAVTFAVCFKPITKAKYTLALYQDNSTTAPVWQLAARGFSADKLFTQTLPRPVVQGLHYYWLYVSGGDYCYTTPICVTGT